MRMRGLRLLWRRLQRRARSFWHWVVLRAVRTWYPQRGDTTPTAAGEVREFPHRSWR
ncbi:MAG: hypothetical protein ACOY93_02555 [Bacillota bacterium]